MEGSNELPLGSNK